MRGRAESMRLLRPRTAKAALSDYAAHPHAIPLAGGTDFMVGWNAGNANGKTILDLSRVSDWKRIEENDDGLTLGSLVTHTELQRDSRMSRRLPLLVEACATVGGLQIQNRGTIGGNLANASPAGDTFPPLLVYDAEVRLRSAAGRRAVSVDRLHTGVKQTSLAPSELIESVSLRFPKPRPTRQVFRKVGTRAASAISKTVMAALLWKRRDGSIRELRIAFGSMAPTARRLVRVEALVRDRKPTHSVVDDAIALLEQELSPIDDLRSTRDYRMTVSRNLLKDLLL